MPGDFTCRVGTALGLKWEHPICLIKNQVPINPLTPRSDFIDLTLSNACWFYSSQGGLLVTNGLLQFRKTIIKNRLCEICSRLVTKPIPTEVVSRSLLFSALCAGYLSCFVFWLARKIKFWISLFRDWLKTVFPSEWDWLRNYFWFWFARVNWKPL